MTEQFELSINPITSTQEEVPIEKIEPWDSHGARSKVKTSMKMLGMISTVILRKHPRKKKQPYSVVDGARRLDELVAHEAESVMAVVLEGANDLEIAASRLSLNLARSPNPIQEAEAIQELIREGATEKAIADHTGVSLAVIRKRLSLLKAPPILIAAAKEKRISTSVLDRVGKCSEGIQQKCLDHFAEIGKLTAEDVRAYSSANTVETLESLDLPFEEAQTDAKDRRVTYLLQEAAEDAVQRDIPLGELTAILESMYSMVQERSEVKS